MDGPKDRCLLSQILQAAGDAPAGLDARARTSFALSFLGLDRLALLRTPELRISQAKGQALTDALAKLAQGHSPARLLGRREFWSLDFDLSPDTLEPRPETEMLVEQALAFLAGRCAPKLADLGTGTGCILLSILHDCPSATGLGLDLSPGAVATAAGNAERLGLSRRARFQVSDWFAALGAQDPRSRFDLLVSNPPYIASAVVDGLPKIVRDQDPRLALEGGADGLEAYRILAAEGQDYLAPDGAILLEIGYDQQDSVGALFQAAGWRDGICKRDLAGQPRTWLWHAGGI
jgi:release factor glutamine methyltransferase